MFSIVAQPRAPNHDCSLERASTPCLSRRIAMTDFRAGAVCTSDPGSTEPLAFDTGCTLPDSAQAPDAPPNRFYAYGVVARLALLAASIELERSEVD